MYEQSGNDTTAWTLIFYDDESRPKQLSYFMSYAVRSGSAVLDTDHINTYDDDGNVELYEVKSGNVSYVFDPTYDSLNRIDSRTASLVTSSGTLTNTVDYEFTANGTNTSLQISKYISTIGSTSTTYQYVYDANGNITQIKNAAGDIRYQYTYDDLGQLIREDNSALNKSFTYTYDLAGNITSRKTYAFTTGTLGTATKTETLGYNDSTWGDRLTSWQGTTITYDEIGNPTWYSIDYLTCLLTWNGRQLASFENMDGLRTYTYNDEGIRIAKNDRGTLHTYQLNGTQIVSETWGIHTIFYVYDEMGSIAGMRYRTSNYAEGVFDEYLFEKNLQGDVVAIYNASGVKLVSYTYDAWGKVTTTYSSEGASTPARFNPFKYRGYYHDSDTNLYYLNSRYYDPATGRFINADSYVTTGQGILGNNMYAYCGNDPVNRFDPTGHDWEWSTFWTGLFMVGTAITAIALSVTTFGAGIPLAMSIVAGVTLGAGVLTGINGVATMIEAGTDYNFVRDGLFNDVLGLSDSAYNVYAGITEGVAAVGSMILGFYHTTGQYKAAKASQQYLGKGYTKAGKNRWVSADGYRQVRWDTTHHMYKGKPSPVHFNWYEYQYPIAPGVRNKLVSDVHVWLKWFSYYM